MGKILIAEDEQMIRDFMVFNLKKSGYDVIEAADGEEALEKYYENRSDIDILILDIMMPGTDGLTVCKRVREENQTVGIIFLTAKTQEMDKITGLVSGSDDYITKPLNIGETMARVDALYRRVSLNKNNNPEAVDHVDTVTSGVFALNLKNHTFTKNGVPVELTPVEFLIMKFFMSHENESLDRIDILNNVWGSGYIGDDKVVDVNIRRLRVKVEDNPSYPVHIATAWGVGYKWVP